MDKDFIWEADYGRREHLRNVFKDLLRKQNAQSLQCLALYINNVPYNLEFFILTSYDNPNANDIEYMRKKFNDAGLIYRQDLTMSELMRQMANRRFQCVTLIDENWVDMAMDNFFQFAEIAELEKLGYGINPFGKENEVFISHSSKDKQEVEKLLPFINAADLPIWFDKYNIDFGQSIVDKVQEGVENSYAVIFWITKNFLKSKWCETEMRAFVRRMIEEDILIICILNKDVSIDDLPIFLRDIKFIKRENESIEEIAKSILPPLKKYFMKNM